MLSFFYKYQKSFLFSVVAILLLSLMSTGIVKICSTFSLFKRKSSLISKIVYEGLDGQKVSKELFDDLVNFLNYEIEPVRSEQAVVSQNFLNPGLVSKFFINPKIAGDIFDQLGEDLIQDLKEKIEREKKFLPYVHPDAAFVSSESVWSTFAPGLKKIFHCFVDLPSPLSKEAFICRCQLYQEQKNFPGALLKRALLYQEQHFLLKKDPLLAYANYSLFGYRNVVDWFGANYMHYVAKMIMEGAAQARINGMGSSQKDLKKDLYIYLNTVFEDIKGSQFFKDVGEMYAIYLRNLGWSEERFLKLWEEISLFAQYALTENNLEKSSDISYMMLREYSLPKELQISSDDLYLFDTYLRLVTDLKNNDWLVFPNAFLPVEEVVQKAPELLGKEYKVSYSSISLEELEGDIGVVEMVEWMRLPENWKILQQLNEIASSWGSWELLSQRATDKEKLSIEALARQEIIKSDPEKIQKALMQRPKQEADLLFCGGSSFILQGLRDSKSFQNALEQNEPLLKCYSQDGETYYSFEKSDLPTKSVILSFKKAHEVGLLKDLAKRLDIHGIATSKKEAIQDYCKDKLRTTEVSLAKLYFWPFMEQFQKLHDEPINALWKPVETEKILNSVTEPKLYKQLEGLSPGEFSEVILGDSGPVFYCCIYKTTNTEQSLPQHWIKRLSNLSRLKIKDGCISDLLKTNFYKNVHIKSGEGTGPIT